MKEEFNLIQGLRKGIGIFMMGVLIIFILSLIFLVLAITWTNSKFLLVAIVLLFLISWGVGIIMNLKEEE